MIKWLKSLFGVRPAEPNNYIEGVLEKSTPEVDVKEVTKQIKESMDKVKADMSKIRSAKPTVDELMVMTKKEMIQYAEDHGIEVKAHWTKKNIAAEICR